jgi:hypothetical protein
MIDIRHPQNCDGALQERFVLDEKRNVIDKLNPTGRKAYCFKDSPEDQIDLRERTLLVRLGELVDDLINVEPEQTDRWGNTRRPFNNEAHAIWHAIYCAIIASRLNALEPAVSLQNRFDGTLKRQKAGLQEVTSLSLFRDDVERLLRDLYGDIESDALDSILKATFVMVQKFTQYVRKDLGRNIKMQRIGITFAGSAYPRDWVFLMAIIGGLTERAPTSEYAFTRCAQTPPPSANTRLSSQHFTLRNL